MELPEQTAEGIECPNCDNGTEMKRDRADRDHYQCPKCGYEEQR